jgi:hypothetical protein
LASAKKFAQKSTEREMARSKPKQPLADHPSGPGAAAATPATTELVKPYEPTVAEQRTLEAQRTRRQQERLQIRVRASMKGDEVSSLQPDHADATFGHLLLLDSLGSTRVDFSAGLLAQLANAATKGRIVDEGQLNFMLAMVTGIEPRDQLEAMLAAQMAAVHNATMTFARRLNHVDNIPQQDSAERAFNKLARTFACQLQALKAYRSSGQQHVTVTHLNVAAHQAQVNVGTSPGGGGHEKSEEQPHGQLAHAPGATLPGDIEAERQAMPGTRDSR